MIGGSRRRPGKRAATRPYLDSAYADHRLRQPLHGQREEEGDGELDGSVQGHGDEHGAGGDGVPQQNVHGEGHKHNDLAAGKEGGHVESPQVGAPHDLADFFPGTRKDTKGGRGLCDHGPSTTFHELFTSHLKHCILRVEASSIYCSGTFMMF